MCIRDRGKTSSSVSSKTSYLINNDISSVSSKNKKAKELGIPIITEEDFLKMIEEWYYAKNRKVRQWSAEETGIW